MFGGLDLKGGGGSSTAVSTTSITTTPTQPAESGTNAGGGAATTSSSSSAFSFLMGSTTTESQVVENVSTTAAAAAVVAAPSTTGMSAFSFLSTSTVDTTSNNNNNNVANLIPSPSNIDNSSSNITSSSNTGGLSSFSFMSSTPATSSSPSIPTVDQVTTSEIPPKPSTAATAEPSSLSSFNFLQSTTTTATTTITSSDGGNVEPTTSSIPTTTTSSNVFDFMTTSIPKPPPSPYGTPTTMLQQQKSITTTNMNPSNTIMGGPTIPTTATTVAGTGVVFGNAAMVPKVAVKKRTRTAKIGAGATMESIPPIPSTATTTLPPPPQQQVVVSQSNVSSSTSTSSISNPTTTTTDVRDAALAASRRADEFLRAKQQQQQEEEKAAAAAKASMMTIESVPSEEDDIIIAAKAAAKEAQKLSAKGHIPGSSSTGGGGAFSSLFRSRSTSHNNSNNNNNTKSTPSIVSYQSQQHGVSASSSIGSTESAGMETNDHVDDVVHIKRLDNHLHDDKLDNDTTTSTIDYKAPNSTSTSTFVPPAIIQPTSTVRSFMSSPKKSTQTLYQQQQQPAIVDVLSAPKPKTPTDIFHDMLQEFYHEVVQSMNEVTRLRQHRAGLLEERFVTNAKERLAVQQRKQAELHQITAAENEDFDLADQMSAIIDRHSREQAEYGTILENIGRAITELDRQKIECVEKVTQCFVNIQKKLSAFQKAQESADTKNAAEAIAKFKVLSKQLSTEQERLQNDLKHIERDAELIADERKELEKAISEQSGEFEKLRDQARSRLTAVEEEIEELMKKLQLKQKEAAELRTEAAGHDESVLKVRVKFARQLTRLQKKELTIKDNRDEWESEKRSFETNKQIHDDQVREHSEAMIARDSLLETLGKEIDMSDMFASIVAKEIGFDVSGGTDEPECDNEMAQMQADVVKCEAAVSESKNALKSITSILKNLEDEIQLLETQIPQLEEIKKSAAEKRDFKGAGKASKEIKEATVRLAECKEELANDIINRKAAAESEYAKLEEELDKARTLANEMERESGMATMTRLADNIKRLLATKQTVCKSSTDLSVSKVGAFVLDAQIKVLMMEGQAYGDKYGHWAELISDLDVSNENEQGPAVPTDPVANESSAGTASNNTVKEESNSTTSAQTDSISLEDKMKKFRDVSNRLKECEDQLEAAVAGEDFEKAAELDEVLQQLLAEVQALNMTDDEMEAALVNDNVDVGSTTVQEMTSSESLKDDTPQEELQQEPSEELIQQETLEESIQPNEASNIEDVNEHDELQVTTTKEGGHEQSESEIGNSNGTSSEKEIENGTPPESATDVKSSVTVDNEQPCEGVNDVAVQE